MNISKVENRGLDNDLFQLIVYSFGDHNCQRAMGINLMYLGKGIAGMQMYPKSIYSTPGSRVHGGIIATLADYIMGAAVTTLNGSIYRTIEMNLNYFKPVFEEKELVGEGRVIYPGNTTAVVEGNIFNHQGILVAKSRGTFIKDTKSKFRGN